MTILRTLVPALAIVAALADRTRAEERLPAADLETYLAGETSFPDDSWRRLERPGAAGWDVAALQAAESRFQQLESAALVAVHRGIVIAS